MSRELGFFTIDEKKAKLIESLSKIGLARLEEAPARLREVQEELEKTELRLLEGLGPWFKELRSKLEWLSRQLVERGLMKREEHDRCFSIIEETSQGSDLKEVALKCMEELSQVLAYIAYVYCGLVPKEELKQICSVVGEIRSSDLYKLYERYQRLREDAETLSAVIEYVKDVKEEHASLAKLVRVYRELKKRDPYLDHSNFTHRVNKLIINSNDISPLLRNLRDLAEVGEVDLVKAYSYVVKLTKSLSIESVEEWQYVREGVVLSGVEPALAYVLAHAAERVDPDELARELEVYARSELAGPGRSEEKARRLHLNLVKIVSLPLCLAASGVDWRLAIALGLSAARYWSRWHDARSFIELCGALKTLSQCASKEEVERVLVYATLFGDYDFIVKLKPLLRKYRSLRSLSSRL